MLSTLLYGGEEYGPEESVHIQVGHLQGWAKEWALGCVNPAS